MANDWEPIMFEVLAYKNTGTHIIRTSEEVGQLLDDHIVMTQSMSFSPYKKPFEDRISKWEQSLKVSQVRRTRNSKQIPFIIYQTNWASICLAGYYLFQIYLHVWARIHRKLETSDSKHFWIERVGQVSLSIGALETKAYRTWLLQTSPCWHIFSDHIVLVCLHVEDFVTQDHPIIVCGIFFLSRKCWISGCWCRGSGFIWSRFSARLTSPDNCLSRASDIRQWKELGGRSWGLPRRIQRFENNLDQVDHRWNFHLLPSHLLADTLKPHYISLIFISV